jgi:hypothetical protein
LGKARVMSYEDLQVARAKRAEKEADKAGKKKQGRKRRSRMQERHAGREQQKVQCKLEGKSLPASCFRLPRHDEKIAACLRPTQAERR